MIEGGRRSGKSVEEIAEVGVTCVDDAGRCGWGAPNFPVLRDAWREIKQEFAPFIREVRESEWTIHFSSGGMLECWSFDGGIVARGRKYHKFVIDEAALVPNLGGRFDAEIEPTLADYDGVLVAGSTPNGVGRAFAQWRQLGQDPGTGWRSWRWTSLDNPVVSATMEKMIRGARDRGVPEWVIRQEYFAEECVDDTGFFPRPLIERLRREHARPPLAVGTLDCAATDIYEREAVVYNCQSDRVKWTDDPYGPWKFWQWWDGRRPPQGEGAFAYGVGVDLSWGQGASNTVITVANADTREIIAEYASPNVSPEQAAVLVAMACYWLGGRAGCRVPLVAPEANGPGETFIRHARALKFGCIVRDRPAASSADQSSEDRWGWRSGPSSKRILLDSYRAALATGRIVNPSEASLDECLTYHQDGKGRILSEREWTGEDTGETARAPHGDRCIAASLCNMAIQQIGAARMPVLPALPGTIAGVLARKAEARRKREAW